MSQSKKWSTIESIIQVVVGYWIAIGVQLIVFPLFDMQITIGEHLSIGIIMLIVSFTRAYIIRRIFDRYTGISNE